MRRLAARAGSPEAPGERLLRPCFFPYRAGFSERHAPLVAQLATRQRRTAQHPRNPAQMTLPTPLGLLLLGAAALLPAASAFKLRSSAFDDGESIPSEYLKDDDNISPPLEFDDVPDGEPESSRRLPPPHPLRGHAGLLSEGRPGRDEDLRADCGRCGRAKGRGHALARLQHPGREDHRRYAHVPPLTLGMANQLRLGAAGRPVACARGGAQLRGRYLQGV